MVALAHGTNDAQKTMGVIVLILVAGGQARPDCRDPRLGQDHLRDAIALGTFSGGWRVIRTLGSGSPTSRLRRDSRPRRGSTTAILSSSYFGFSLSTTQVVSGGIMGAGLGKAGGFIHWAVVRSMVICLDSDHAGGRRDGRNRLGDVAELPERHGGLAFVGIVAAVILVDLHEGAANNVTADNVMDEDVPPTEDSLRPVLASV